jgi:hypothetical protein
MMLSYFLDEEDLPDGYKPGQTVIENGKDLKIR